VRGWTSESRRNLAVFDSCHIGVSFASNLRRQVRVRTRARVGRLQLLPELADMHETPAEGRILLVSIEILLGSDRGRSCSRHDVLIVAPASTSFK
jgi:hypothetical protein